MTWPKQLLGAALLSALCLCALSTTSASATTVRVCKSVFSGFYTNSDCSKAGIGSFETVVEEIGKNVTATTEGTTKFTVTAKLEGVAGKISCTTMSGGWNAENFINEKSEEEVKGTNIKMKFSGCTVEEPAGKGCKVKGGGFETPALTGLTAMEKSAEPTAFEISPPIFNPLGEITLEGCSIPALNTTFKLQGKLVGYVTAESPSRIEFTKAGTEAGGLTLGGNKAGVEGVFRSYSPGTGGETLGII
jgi:hypothetical protein